jgi:hypothetical protein
MPLRWADGTTVFVVGDQWLVGVLLAARRQNTRSRPATKGGSKVGAALRVASTAPGECGSRCRNDEAGPLRRRENGKSKPLPVESAGRGLHQWSEARPQDAGENRVV